MLRSVMVLLASAALVACTTLRPLPVTIPADIRLGLKKGALVSVLTKDRQTYELNVRFAGDDALYGFDSDWMNHRIPYTDIAQIEVERFSLWQTVSLGATMTVAFLVFSSKNSDE